MSVSLTHATVAAGTDAGNGEIGKSQWNEEHTLSMATARMLGRTTAGAGAVEEISVGDGLSLAAGALTATATAAKQANWDTAYGWGDHASAGYVTPTGSAVLTNKTIDSFTNTVEADALHIQVRNDTGSTLAKGSPVYISGFNLGQLLPTVAPADASVLATMPALGLVTADIANNTNGSVERVGILTGVDTSAWTEGTLLYVSETAGALTSTAPTGAALVQPIATVLRSHAVTGALEICDRGVTDLTAAQAAALYVALTGNQTVAGDKYFSGNIGFGGNTVPDVPLDVLGNFRGHANGSSQTIQSRVSSDTAANTPLLNMSRARGTGAGGSRTIVQSGDFLGQWGPRGYDGANYIQAATITAKVDGTPGTNDMPGRWEFATTPAGSSTPVLRMTISSSAITAAASAPFTGPATGLTGTAASLTAGLATAVAGGAANKIVYQSGAGVSAFIDAPTVASTYLRWNAAGNAFEWGAPSGSGTVTSVAMTVPTGLSVSGSPVTTTGTLAVSLDSANGYQIPRKFWIRAASSRALNNVGTEQAIFNSPANGRLTIPTGAYFFEGQLYLTGMSGTSGNLALDPLGAGTATCADWLYHAVGIDNTTPTNAGTQTGSFTVTQQSVASIVTATTGTAMGITIKGTFEVSSGGTLIPSVTLVTGAAATLAAGSWMSFERIGAASDASYGPWD